MLVGNFLFQSTEKYYSVLQSATPVLLCTTKYYSVLQSTMLGDLVNFGKIWPSRSRPRSRPFQTRSRPVPWNPRAVSIHSHVAKKTKQVCASSAESFDSRHSVPDVRKRHFTKVVVPDVRIIAERSRPVYRPIATLQLWTCVKYMYRSSPFRSSLNTGYSTTLDMCEVCKSSVNSCRVWHTI